MEILHIFLAVFGLLNLAFVASFYFQSNRTAAITFYSLILVFASVWSLSTLVMSLPLPFIFFILATNGHYIFGYLAYLSFFWFALFYPTAPSRRLVRIGLALTSVSLALLAAIPFHYVVFGALLPSGTFAQRIIFNPVGYLIFIYALAAVFSLGLLVLLYRSRHIARQPEAPDSLNRAQVYLAIVANLVAGILGISLNLLLPLEGNFSFFYVNPIFVTAALVGIGLYNFTRFKFFNARLITAEFLIACIWILLFTRVLFYTGNSQELYSNFLVLALTTAIGIVLVRSIQKETVQHELIEKQEKALESANAKQETLLHFISHEVKGYFTKASAAFAGIGDGDYGAISPELKEFSGSALDEMRKGTETVVEILEAGDFKKGTVTLAHEPFDLKVSVERAVEEHKAAAEEKRLAMNVTIEPNAAYTVIGDEPQLRKHVIGNLIDNAVNYTPKGSVAVSLFRQGKKVLFSVKDTGVGITPEDKERLFTEGGRGAQSVKVNVHSTGYGLFIAKSIVAAHGGRIWAQSEGTDKGSTFFVELPAASVQTKNTLSAQ